MTARIYTATSITYGHNYVWVKPTKPIGNTEANDQSAQKAYLEIT